MNATTAWAKGMTLPANIFLKQRMDRLEIMVFGEAFLRTSGEQLETAFEDRMCHRVS